MLDEAQMQAQGLLEIGLFLNPTFWFFLGSSILAITFFIELLDHGLFSGIPAFLMMLLLLIAPDYINSWAKAWVSYGVLVFIFYIFCWRFRRHINGPEADINDN